MIDPTPMSSSRSLILSLPAFRRLGGKTQVVTAPDDAALRTRLTHTLEVAAMARHLARGLQLDEDLAECIALAHDIGHPAFGHAGERALASLSPDGFHHAAHGVRVLTTLLPTGKTLPGAVVDGVLKHSKGRSGPAFARGPALSQTSVEALVVRACDLYSYAWHDLEDAYALGLVSPEDLPREAVSTLGSDPQTVRDRLLAFTAAASSSFVIALPDYVHSALEALREHLYANLYESALLRDQTLRARHVLEDLFADYVRNEESFLLRARRTVTSAASVELRAVDTLASLGDQEALMMARKSASPAVAA